MTADAGNSPRPSAGRPVADLESDPEALEDPVHRGDAKHQHEAHQHQHDEEKAAGSDQSSND